MILPSDTLTKDSIRSLHKLPAGPDRLGRLAQLLAKDVERFPLEVHPPEAVGSLTRLSRRP